MASRNRRTNAPGLKKSAKRRQRRRIHRAERLPTLESLEARRLFAGLEDAAEVVPQSSTPALVQYDLEVTNQEGNPVETAQPGEKLLLNVHVVDKRTFGADGVFAAYVDIIMSDLVAPDGDIVFGSDYQNGKSGQVAESGVDELGGFSGLGYNESRTLLAQIPITALAEGQATIAANPADDLPHHETLLLGTPSTVENADIQFDALQLQIEELQWHNTADPIDVNGDGVVAPIDALLIINHLNAGNPGALPDSNPGTAMVDVDDDGYVSPRDVLRVINELNKPPTEPQEPEAANFSEIAAGVVGLPVDSAEEVVTESGGILKIVASDGQEPVGNEDYVPNRINVAVDSGFLTAAWSEWEFELLYPYWYAVDNGL